MSGETEKLCLEEIDHLVFDSDKKITLTYISNTWNISSKDGEQILEKWLKNNASAKNIVKEYLIRGEDLKGNSIITIVSEKNLPKVKKVCPNHTRTLYSVEIGSNNGKSLNIQEPTPNKYISLKVKSNPRTVKVAKIIVPATEKSIKKEVEPPKKTNNIFSAAQSKSAQSKSNQSKDEKNHSGSKDTKVKQETLSPKKQSPRKQPPAKQSKSSIASFFGSKPTTSTSNASKTDKSVSEAAKKIESVKIKEETVDVAPIEAKSSQKRPLPTTSEMAILDSNDDRKSAEKKETQKKKKMKLEKKTAHSRLMQICDSSSDEEDTSKSRNDTPMDTEEEVVVKKDKENKTPSPDKSSANIKTGSSSGKRRAKVKKTVTRTYEDEDGFINTVHEVEEVSCSDDEPEVLIPAKKPTPVSNNSSTTAAKKKISPPAGKKQGSILSFFGKK